MMLYPFIGDRAQHPANSPLKTGRQSVKKLKFYNRLFAYNIMYEMTLGNSHRSGRKKQLFAERFFLQHAMPIKNNSWSWNGSQGWSAAFLRTWSLNSSQIMSWIMCVCAPTRNLTYNIRTLYSNPYDYERILKMQLYGLLYWNLWPESFLKKICQLFPSARGGSLGNR